jgi:hypothetical protein
VVLSEREPASGKIGKDQVYPKPQSNFSGFSGGLYRIVFQRGSPSITIYYSANQYKEGTDMRVRLERRHSNASTDRRKDRCVSKGDHAFIVLKNDLKNGTTRSRCFYGAMKEEIDHERSKLDKTLQIQTDKAQQKSEHDALVLKYRNGTLRGDDALNVLTRSVTDLKMLLSGNQNPKQPRQPMAMPLMNQSKSTTRLSSLRTSPIHKAAGRRKMREMRKQAGTPPLLKLDGLISYFKQPRQTSPIHKTPPTPQIAKRLNLPANYTGLQKRHQLGKDTDRSKSLGGATMSSQDLREERTARLAFSKSLRGDDFYHMGDR